MQRDNTNQSNEINVVSEKNDIHTHEIPDNPVYEIETPTKRRPWYRDMKKLAIVGGAIVLCIIIISVAVACSKKKKKDPEPIPPEKEEITRLNIAYKANE